MTSFLLVLFAVVAALGVGYWAGAAKAAELPSPDPPLPPTPTGPQRREALALAASIDGAVMPGAIALFFAAAAWLVAATAMSAAVSVLLVFPSIPLVRDVPMFSVGRLREAAAAATVYGWLTPAALGCLIWLVARLAGRVPCYPSVFWAAALLWNIGVAAGVVCVLFGLGTGVPFLPFPGNIPPILLTAFVAVAIGLALMVSWRRALRMFAPLYIAFAALFWFPWAFGTANAFLVWTPVAPGPAQPVAAAWFAHAMVWLWLVPAGLAIALYLVPRLTARPLDRYEWVPIAFWSMAFLAAWGGGQRLTAWPVPLWVQAVGQVSTMLLALPVLLLVMVIGGPLLRAQDDVARRPQLWFVSAAMLFFCLFAALDAALALRGFSEVFGSSMLVWGRDALALHGFASFMVAAGIYHIVPRVLGWNWPSLGLILLHFWFSAIGVGLLATLLVLGGMFEGLAQYGATLGDRQLQYVTIASYRFPFLAAQPVAWLAIMTGHLAFLLSLLWMVTRELVPWIQVTFLEPLPDAAARSHRGEEVRA